MKKIGLFLLATAALFLGSCKEKEYDGADSAFVVTVRTMPVGSEYYFDADTGHTIYPSDKSRIGAYEAREGQRAIITFKSLPSIPGYDISARLYSIGDIYTGTGRIIADAEEVAELSDDPIQLYRAGSYLTHKYLTLYVVYSANDKTKHRFELVVNDAAPSSTDPNYLDVELRHAADGDLTGPHCEDYISFDITPFTARLSGKNGIALRVRTGVQSNSIQTYKIDFTQTGR